VGEGRAQLVVLDLADEGGAGAESGDADNGIGGRTAGNLDRRTHGVIDLRGARLVDQRHAALAHVVRDEKCVIGAGDDVDNGIAEAENVVANGGHGAFHEACG
jgi:hypothetical protein